MRKIAQLWRLLRRLLPDTPRVTLIRKSYLHKRHTQAESKRIVRIPSSLTIHLRGHKNKTTRSQRSIGTWKLDMLSLRYLRYNCLFLRQWRPSTRIKFLRSFFRSRSKYVTKAAWHWYMECMLISFHKERWISLLWQDKTVNQKLV